MSCRTCEGAERPHRALFDLPAAAVAQRAVEFQDDEFAIVGLAGADVPADAEWIVVIVQHTDGFAIEKEHVFDGDEREGEVSPRPTSPG